MDRIDRPAGFWIRLGAIILDAFIISLPLALIDYFITGQLRGQGISNVIYFLYGLIVPVVWYGYTVGKRLAGIRIARTNGEKVSLWTMIKRNVIAGLVYGITFGIALIVSILMIAFRQDKRSLHDMIAGTYVTKNPPI